MVIEPFDIDIKGDRKLKARWSLEANQDLQSVHNLNAAQQLTDILVQELNAEIDAEILNDLRNNSGIGSVSTFPANYYNTYNTSYTPTEPTPEPAKKQYRSIDDEWE